MSAAYQRFLKVRKQVIDVINKMVEEGCDHKSFEGAFEVMAYFPDAFDDEADEVGPTNYAIELHCYLLGPGRHYQWSGRTLDEAVSKCEKDVSEWVKGWI